MDAEELTTPPLDCAVHGRKQGDEAVRGAVGQAEARAVRTNVVGIDPDAVGRHGEMVGCRDGARQAAVGHVHSQGRRHHLGDDFRLDEPLFRIVTYDATEELVRPFGRLPKRFGETVASQLPRFVELEPPLRLLIRAWPSGAVQNEVAAVWFAPTVEPAKLLGDGRAAVVGVDQPALGTVEVARGQAELGDDRPANKVDLIVGAGYRDLPEGVGARSKDPGGHLGDLLEVGRAGAVVRLRRDVADQRDLVVIPAGHGEGRRDGVALRRCCRGGRSPSCLLAGGCRRMNEMFCTLQQGLTTVTCSAASLLSVAAMLLSSPL